MNRPKWLQDDLKIIAQWWSTRFMGIGTLCAIIGSAVAYASPGYVFMDRLGKYGYPFLGILFVCGALAQFYKQKKLRSVSPELADEAVKKANS